MRDRFGRNFGTGAFKKFISDGHEDVLGKAFAKYRIGPNANEVGPSKEFA